MKKRLLLLLTLFCSTLLYSQEQDENSSSTDKGYNRYEQKVAPLDFDNYDFCINYMNGSSCYTIKSFQIMELTDPIIQMATSPSGSSFAALTRSKKGKNRLYIYDLLVADKRIFRSGGDLEDIVTICFAKNARNIYLASSLGEITSLDTKKYEVQERFDSQITNPSMIYSSYDGYYLAVVSEYKTKVNIINLESATIRKEFSFNSEVSGVDFSHDGSQLAISTSDGVINIYDTRTFLHTKVIVDAGEARCCRFHPDGKYIIAIHSPEKIEIINLLDDTDRLSYPTQAGTIGKFNTFTQYDKSYLVYNEDKAIVLQNIADLKPFYNQLLTSELDDRMGTWLKMMDGETLDEYNERVTDDSRMEQMVLFEQEIATTLAADLVERSEVSAGDYNLESNMLALDFNTMPTIYLEVPTEEASDFMDTNNLEFRNAKYAITTDDQFELIYADIFNTKSGKSYTFDNLERKSLEYLKSDDDYISLELVKQSNMDVIKLEEIKEAIVAEAKKESIISDHTNILVDANIIPSTDADGNNIVNYNINFSYQVEPKFSAVEDFKPGLYQTKQSGAASSMLKVVEQALSGDFEQYVESGKKLKIVVSGDADASPIKSRMTYSGVYGNLVNIPVYNNGRLSNVTVTKESGITQNEQLALLRAWGVQEMLLENNPQLKEMDVEIDYYISVQKEKGGAFRRIKVELIFVDAL